MKGKAFDKRRSRSKVVLDVDDVYILDFLSVSRDKEDYGKNIAGMALEGLKKKMNMSHNALLVHLRRLLALNLIVIWRVPPSNKEKIVNITKNGRRIKEELFEAINLMEEKKFKLTIDKKTFFGRDKTEDVTIGDYPAVDHKKR